MDAAAISPGTVSFQTELDQENQAAQALLAQQALALLLEGLSTPDASQQNGSDTGTDAGGAGAGR